jgi:hypothetical protein
VTGFKSTGIKSVCFAKSHFFFILFSKNHEKKCENDLFR